MNNLGLAVFLASGVILGALTTEIAPEGMMLVPAGEFLMGSSFEEVAELKKKFGKRDFYKNYSFESELPQKKIYLNAFYIDRHEVTNREYIEFVNATGKRPPKHWTGGIYKSGKGNHPVIYVSQTDATDYARWAGKRLPTEAEWEKAARSNDGRIFPWGNKFDPYKAVTAESDLKLILGALCSVNSANMVELAPGDISPYGVRDMAGNVREWTSTALPGSTSMVRIKGGSWVDLSVNARSAHREYAPKDSISHIIGFRCAKDENS